MKKLINHDKTDIFGMSNLNPSKAGLGDIVIWSDHGGVTRSVSNRNTPRMKLTMNDISISITISDEPKVLSKNKKVTSKHKLNLFKDGVEYVARNYDIFLKHYNDTNFEFDDEDMYDALRERGEYK